MCQQAHPNGAQHYYLIVNLHHIFISKKKAFSCPNFVTKQSYQRTIKKNNPAKYDYQDPEPAFIYLGISRIYGLSAITAQWPY